MLNNFKKVIEFHNIFRPGSVAKTPRMLSRELSILRIRLIAEELAEYAQAVGIRTQISVASGSYVYTSIDSDSTDQIEAADALGDILYVTYGAAAEHGFPINEVFNEIHRSNMTKLGADGQPIIVDGKVQKGPGYRKPDIKAVLDWFRDDPDAKLSGVRSKR